MPHGIGSSPDPAEASFHALGGAASRRSGCAGPVDMGLVVVEGPGTGAAEAWGLCRGGVSRGEGVPHVLVLGGAGRRGGGGDGVRCSASAGGARVVGPVIHIPSAHAKGSSLAIWLLVSRPLVAGQNTS